MVYQYLCTVKKAGEVYIDHVMKEKGSKFVIESTDQALQTRDSTVHLREIHKYLESHGKKIQIANTGSIDLEKL